MSYLPRWLFPCVCVWFFAGLSHGRSEPLNLASLVSIANRYNLPMPPKDAPLVLAHTGAHFLIGNSSTSRDPGEFSPAFLISELTNQSIIVLRGAELETVEAQGPSELLWRPFSMEKVIPSLGGYAVSLNRLSAFVCAVQLAAQGQKSAAQAIWRQLSATNNIWWADAEPFNEVNVEAKNPALLLARCIYDHQKRTILQEPNRWPAICLKLSALFREFPALTNRARCEVLAGLAMAVNSPPPPTNSVEAMLLAWSRQPAPVEQFQNSVSHDNDVTVLAGQILKLHGIAAVPKLISLLDDQRITTHEVPAFMNAPARISHVGELATLLLEAITGLKGSNPWEPPQAAAFQAWFATQGAKSETERLADTVFILENGKITAINEVSLCLLTQKQPERLASLCDEYSRNAQNDDRTFSLTSAVATSSLSQETKVSILSHFAEGGSLARKRIALQTLATIDAKKCVALLLPTLATLPKDCTGPYWISPEAAFTHVVMELENDDAWRGLLTCAKRSSVGLRMELMEPLNCNSIGKSSRSRRIAFLAAFLDDKSERDLASDTVRFGGPCAAFTIPKITVQNFAAEQLATILGLPESPDEFWSSAQWAHLRKKVRNQLLIEKVPGFEPPP